MGLVRILAMLAITAIVAEFGLHIIYHWKTGEAGLYDPAFEYMKHLDRIRSKGGKRNVGR